MLNLVILILNISSLDCFCALPSTLNAKSVFLLFGAMARENIKYVVIVFQNIFVKTS